MKQWNGLWHKEWIQMKAWLFSLLILGALVVFMAPTLIVRFFGEVEKVGTITLILGMTWVFFHSLIGVIMLFTSLGKEMTRQDIWLHSNASIYKLIGVKFAFTLASVMISLVFISLSATVVFLAQTPQLDASITEIFRMTMFIGLANLLSTVFITCVGFFFWVMYYRLRMLMGGIAIPVTIVLFIISGSLWDRMLTSTWFDKIFGFGEITVTTVLPTELIQILHTFDISSANPLMFGVVIFFSLVTVGLFILSSTWFDKKVRV
jgi:hypothetical protein